MQDPAWLSLANDVDRVGRSTVERLLGATQPQLDQTAIFAIVVNATTGSPRTLYLANKASSVSIAHNGSASQFSFRNPPTHMSLNDPTQRDALYETEALLDQAPLNVKGGLASKEGKTCVLMQAYIGGLPVKAFALVSDCTFIAQSAARIARGLFEITLARGWLSYAEKVLVASDWC
jgi:hypothetical protein